MSTEFLEKQRDLVTQFGQWFNSGDDGLKAVMDDNRRRYRMKLADEAERTKRGLSALPSTKSTSTVDNYVNDAMEEYHGEPDAITFTAKDTADPLQDDQARWLTEIVKYRMAHTFPFHVYHMQTLKAGAVDGMEAALVSWVKETYAEKYEVEKFFYAPPGGDREEIPEDVYRIGSVRDPEAFVAEAVTEKEEVVTRDTWWIDQLKPGESILWDFKAPLLDVNTGEWCLVILYKSMGQIEDLARQGVFDKIKSAKVREVLKSFQETQSNEHVDKETVSSDPDTIDTGNKNRVPVWLFFEKDQGCWMCSFSAKGEKELSSQRKVNEVFWGGRRVNRLPVVLGCIDFELWQAVGRGLPKLIAPIEDEHIDAKNNANDYAKQVIQGRVRVRPSADVDIDAILNSRAFYAEQDDVEFLEMHPGFLENLRVADSHNADIAELAPVSMESRNFVPKGTSKTLGALQAQLQSTDKKLNSRLLVRNETFFKPLLYLIAQMEFSFETDQTILRIAGQKAKMQIPMAMGQQGPVVDIKALDFDFLININAGLGNVPKQIKAEKIIQIAEWRRANGVHTDMGKIAAQLNILAGFAVDQFDLDKKQIEPPKPQVDATVNLTVDLNDIPEDLQRGYLELMISGLGSGKNKVKASVREDKEQTKRIQAVQSMMNDQTPLVSQGMEQ